ncbi:4-alpha-glucanotransferase [Pantoea ananatis]|uniref:4-alpha-glucanotransferase n=1 Tax=Pantoea ananas TaxID=553 RepID=UPI000CF4C808|nr:4-alpha-glucanotransferase [Pantoea ananatis]MBA4819832.1 4-alpha-glucanotransferase [Pantoea ananatis]PQK82369.1 4-alpha-glucanotransferase [Pantoea ananatis]QKV86677.1 4-alpha-glucanotransferase [Pantoea ananatis]
MKPLHYPAGIGRVATEYVDAHGAVRQVSASTRDRLLAAMQPGPGPGVIPPVAVFTQGLPIRLTPSLAGPARWHLEGESGERWSGHCEPEASLTLPALPEGYHLLTINADAQQSRCQIIVTPSRCYEPEALLRGERRWGTCVQLYALRSDQNWGIGDFADLRDMVKAVGMRGGAFVGLNPLHALFPALPDDASPYSPSSRRWLNVLYISVPEVEDFNLSAAAQCWWQSDETQHRLHQARHAPWVDYSTVASLKLDALRFAWQQFMQREKEDSQAEAFEAFVAEGGESLLHQGLFDALQAWLREEDPLRHGWQTWPTAYQQPDTAAVHAFRIEHGDEIRFYLWLQWLAARQFAACWHLCQQHQMAPGLYRDLAVGVAAGGSETWSQRGLYCLAASTGAPPDILGPLGQNWGLPPMDPQSLYDRAYEPWITLLRANMRDCGALRIDHVMALLRLWWIPQGETAAAGAYVAYPIDDLLAILALESQRQRCMVIGEDLGTVPEAIVDKLHNAGVYSYKVLYFEQNSHKGFRPPAAWPRQAMAVATTHDMPTLRGWWQSDDLTLGSQLGLYPDKAVLAGLYHQRRAARSALLQTLTRHGYLKPKGRVQANSPRMSLLLNQVIHQYLADCTSALLGLQPEDWLDMASPVNVPGTVEAYPNWRRKLSLSLEAMFADKRITALLEEISRRCS